MKNLFIFLATITFSYNFYQGINQVLEEKKKGEEEAREFLKILPQCQELKKTIDEVSLLSRRMEIEKSHSWVLALKARDNYGCPFTKEVFAELVCADGWKGSSCGCGGGRGCCSHHGGIGYCDVEEEYHLVLSDSNCAWNKSYQQARELGCTDGRIDWKLESYNRKAESAKSNDGWAKGWRSVMKEAGYYTEESK